MKKFMKKFMKKVKEMYDKNFKFDGIWGHYIIPFQNQKEEEFLNNAIHEIWNNGVFTSRQHYIKQMLIQLKKNKTKQDWEKYAKEFVSGFDTNGCIKLLKKKK